MNNEDLKPYPRAVCTDCAFPLRKIADVDGITIAMGTCDVCGKTKGVSTPRDYAYPDFPGFRKVNKGYVWD